MMQNALELLEDLDGETQRLLSYLLALAVLDDEDFNFIQLEFAWYMAKALSALWILGPRGSCVIDLWCAISCL